MWKIETSGGQGWPTPNCWEEAKGEKEEEEEEEVVIGNNRNTRCIFFSLKNRILLLGFNF